jgi:hypothetical protein
LTLVATLVAHLVAFWGAAWLARSPAVDSSYWVLCYLAGAVLPVASRWVHGLRVGPRVALQIIGYASLLALVFWGANMALDLLGNSVKTGRLPPELRTGLPLHLILVPGVASYGLAALVDGLLNPAASKETTEPAG